MATFWMYVRMQLMMFVFGIVGPIFLIGYFATHPNTELRWMYWWGLLITSFDVLLALALTRGAVEADAKNERGKLAQKMNAASNPFGGKRGDASG